MMAATQQVQQQQQVRPQMVQQQQMAAQPNPQVAGLPQTHQPMAVNNPMQNTMAQGVQGTQPVNYTAQGIYNPQAGMAGQPARPNVPAMNTTGVYPQQATAAYPGYNPYLTLTLTLILTQATILT